ncbi:MAG: DUF1365 family protein, partial [Planctomycetota bacterium]
MRSCLYEGVVRHTRRSPVAHRFSYSISMACLDLDEAPELLRRSRLLSSARFAPASLVPEDHLRGELIENSPTGLAASVRRYVHRETGSYPVGRIALLTQLRHFGYYFSPLNLFYCFDAQERVETVLAEVSNTPWNERRFYVLHDGNRTSRERELR